MVTLDGRLQAALTFSCRLCGGDVSGEFVNLGMSPLANSYVLPDDANRAEEFYPLDVRVCPGCFLVQLPELRSASEIFSDYAYMSGYSTSWLEHGSRYCATIVERLSLSADSQVVEVASNDGSFLRFFQQRSIPVLGVEPAKNVAAHAIEQGIPTISEFFGAEVGGRLRSDGYAADLIFANNVLAHVPALNDFVSGLAALLKPTGTVTAEFPHLLRLIEGVQYDTIYHEHFSYLSLMVVCDVFARNGLMVYDVDELTTHGGSLRIYAAAPDVQTRSQRVRALLDEEVRAGVRDLAMYARFGERVRESKRSFLEFLIREKRVGKRIAGYGAAAKGNTLLNYCGVGTDFIDFVVDRNPLKQHTLLPGSRIPVYAPEVVGELRPDFLVIFPWNIKDEVMEQMQSIAAWGGRFVVAIPETVVLP